MRKLTIGIVAAATLMAAVPAMAQIRLEGPGVGVRVGPDRHDHYRYRDGYRAYARDRHCRTVTVRDRLPDGRVVIRTHERC